MTKSNRLLYLLLFVLIALAVILNIAAGSSYISLGDVVKTLLGGDKTSTNFNIIWQLRIPEVIMAILVGMALSLSGLLMQTFFRNPLAGPSVLGLSSGAGLGVALAMMTGVFANLTGSLGATAIQVLASALGTGVVLVLIISIAKVVKDNTSLLLIGLMVGYFASAVVGSLEIFAERISLQKFVFWGMGSFSSVTWDQLFFIAIAISLLLFLSFFISKPLDAYLLGEEYATSMGMDVKKWRMIIILLAGLLTGIVTAFAGPVAFLGLAVPHMARMIFKSAKHSVLIPGSLLLGAGTALLCLLISKLPGLPFRLPINSVTSLIGAPMVIYLVFKQRKMRL
ncbi:MAG: iron complex transport system permease protein [Patiriisocius sp.]|jgi:iron complex transport system permease protein